MAHGGLRPGAGAPRKSRAGKSKSEVVSSDLDGMPPSVLREKVSSAREWGLNALNSADVPLDTKVKIFGYMVGVEAKDAAPQDKKETEREATAEAMTGRFAPRQVKGFGVVDGAKK